MFACRTRGFRPSCHAKRLEEWCEWMNWEPLRSIFSKSRAEMIRKIYEVDLMLCPNCGGSMKVVAFITYYQAVDSIIDHLKLRFVAEKPPPSRVYEQVALKAAEERAEYF